MFFRQFFQGCRDDPVVANEGNSNPRNVVAAKPNSLQPKHLLRQPGPTR